MRTCNKKTVARTLYASVQTAANYQLTVTIQHLRITNKTAKGNRVFSLFNFCYYILYINYREAMGKNLAFHAREVTTTKLFPFKCL